MFLCVLAQRDAVKNHTGHKVIVLQLFRTTQQTRASCRARAVTGTDAGVHPFASIARCTIIWPSGQCIINNPPKSQVYDEHSVNGCTSHTLH